MKGDTLMPHQSLLYRVQDLRDKLPISHLLLMERPVCSINHIRMQVVWARRDQPKGGVLCPYGRTRVVETRGWGIVFHIGTRLRDGYHKGPGPNRTLK